MSNGSGSSGSTAYTSVMPISAWGSSVNRRNFHVEQIQRLMNVATLVQVKKWKPYPYQSSQSGAQGQSGSQGQSQQGQSKNGDVAPIGHVDVLPLVNLLDGAGKPIKHGTIRNMPYFRLHGGSDKAIIMDPKEGDIGLVVFADRDISNVKRQQDQVNPGSRRRFDMSDGIFLGMCLSKEKPKTYHQFTSDNQINHTPDDGKTIVNLKAGKITRTVDVDNGSISDNAKSLLERTVTGSGNINDKASQINHDGHTNVTNGDLHVDQNVNVGQIVTGLGFNTTSDRRSKSRVRKLTGMLDRALQLPLWRFRQRSATIDEDGQVHRKRNWFDSFGAMAQEVRDLFPEIVHGEETKDVLTIQESKLGIVALAALQEYVALANTEIDRLKRRIAALEAAHG